LNISDNSFNFTMLFSGVESLICPMVWIRIHYQCEIRHGTEWF